MKILIAVFAVLALAGCKLPGQKAAFEADPMAFCKNYATADACALDENCEWRGDKCWGRK